MSYELIQSALTAAINATVIIGFTGIVAHSFIQQHRRFMAEFCPPVAPYTPDTQHQPEQPAITDPWEGESEAHIKQPQRLSVRHFSPILALPTESETPAQVKTPVKRGRKPKAQSALAEELGVVPPSDWGKVQQPKKVNHKATRTRKRQIA